MTHEPPNYDFSALGRADLETSLAQALERAEEAEKVERAFLSAMTHELRTPLNAVLGFTDALLQGISGPINDVQRRQLGSIERSAKRLIELVNDTLDLTKALTGGLEPAIEEFDLGLAIETVARDIRAEPERRGLPLELALGEGGCALGDRRRVQQVLRHLMSNAFKFTDSGKVRVELAMSAGVARVAVIDTGIGIAPANLDLIWKPFRQLDTGHARHYDGAGLGLSLAKLMIEAMGGKVFVESEEGKGSSFGFELPTARPGIPLPIGKKTL